MLIQDLDKYNFEQDEMLIQDFRKIQMLTGEISDCDERIIWNIYHFTKHERTKQPNREYKIIKIYDDISDD